MTYQLGEWCTGGVHGFLGQCMIYILADAWLPSMVHGLMVHGAWPNGMVHGLMVWCIA